MAAKYRIVHREWRLRKVFWILMAFELAGLIPILVLFGIEQPDLYRTKFWQIGYDNGLNSNPAMTLYAYANHRPQPEIPFVWSQHLTDFNVALSVIVVFFLLVKLIAFIMNGWYPILAVVVNVAMVAMWTTSVYGQAGPDYADERYPSPVAWYIRMGCDITKPYDAVSHCRLAKGTFAVTIFMLFIFLCNLAHSIYSMIPNELDKQQQEDEEKDDNDSLEMGKDTNWEMRSIRSGTSVRSPTSIRSPTSPRGPFTPGPFTPGPFTPRTTAFRALDRKPTQSTRFT